MSNTSTAGGTFQDTSSMDLDIFEKKRQKGGFEKPTYQVLVALGQAKLRKIGTGFPIPSRLERRRIGPHRSELRTEQQSITENTLRKTRQWLLDSVGTRLYFKLRALVLV